MANARDIETDIRKDDKYTYQGQFREEKQDHQINKYR